MSDIEEQPAPRSSGTRSPSPSNKSGTTAEVTTPDQGDQEQLLQDLEDFEHLVAVDEDSFDQPTTNRKELWAYYLYYNGQ